MHQVEPHWRLLFAVVKSFNANTAISANFVLTLKNSNERVIGAPRGPQSGPLGNVVESCGMSQKGKINVLMC